MVSFIDRLRVKGAVMPSSRFLVRRVLSKIDFSRDLDILQLGFGTGVFARAILGFMTSASSLTVFEVDPRSRVYAIDHQRLRYIEASAELITERCGSRQYDVILSTLPLASLPRRISTAIYGQIKAHLKPGGSFLQYQYSLCSRRAICDLFGVGPSISFEPRNIPPAFIYEVRRP